jgi:hypothetical protein
VDKQGWEKSSQPSLCISLTRGFSPLAWAHHSDPTVACLALLTQQLQANMARTAYEGLWLLLGACSDSFSHK